MRVKCHAAQLANQRHGAAAKAIPALVTKDSRAYVSISVRQRRMISLCPAGLTQALKVWENWLGESHERARLDL